MLLSAVLESVDTDGDRYEVRLAGPGQITTLTPELLTLSGTTGGSRVFLSVTEVNGDGQVDIGQLSTGGATINSVSIQGDLGGLNVGRLNRLDAVSLGRGGNATGVFIIAGPLGRANVPGGIDDANITISGDAGVLQFGDRRDPASRVSNTSISIGGDANRIRIGQSFTAESSLDVLGSVNRLDVDQWIVNSDIDVVGDVNKLSVRGGIRQDSTITVGGDLVRFQARKSVTDLTLTVDGLLGQGQFLTDLRDSTLVLTAVEKLQVRDDLDETSISVTDDLVSLQADDSRGLTLRVSGTLGMLQVRRDLEEALVSSLNGIERVQVRQDLVRCTLVAGIDIGPDLTLDVAPGGDDVEWGDVRIQDVSVGGDFIDSSVSAGVSPRGLWFGDGDDSPTADDQGTSRIERMIVRGDVASSGLPGESYAITASDGVDFIRAGRSVFTGAPGVALQEF